MAETDTRVLEFLEEGLFLYGVGKVQEAIQRWRKVLELDPRNERALDYIESAGGDVSAFRKATPAPMPVAPPVPAPVPASVGGNGQGAVGVPPINPDNPFGGFGAPAPAGRPFPAAPSMPPPPIGSPSPFPTGGPRTDTPTMRTPSPPPFVATPTPPPMPVVTSAPVPLPSTPPNFGPSFGGTNPPRPPVSTPPPTPPPMPPPTPAQTAVTRPGSGETKDDLLLKAGALYRAQQYDLALEILERVAKEFQPIDDTIRGYIDATRTGLLNTLRGQWSHMDRVPRPKMNPQQVMTLKLSPEAGFLLSRIDGASTLEEILSISGVEELTALRALSSLVQSGVIELA